MALTREELEAVDAYRDHRDTEKQVLTKGQKKAAAAKISFDSAVALTKLILRQRQINNLRKLQAQRAAALREPTVTDADMAQYQAMADAAVREAMATGARGGSGIDIDRLRRARELALKKFGQKLSKGQETKLKARQETGKEMQADAEALRKMQSEQITGTFKDIKDVVEDKGTIKLLGQAGIKKRAGELKTDVDEKFDALEKQRKLARGTQVVPTPKTT